MLRPNRCLSMARARSRLVLSDILARVVFGGLACWLAFGLGGHRLVVVQPVAANGKTLYRLRVNAGGANQAADICGRLRVAGESCFVAS